MATIDPRSESFRAGSWGNAGVKVLQFVAASGDAAIAATNDLLLIPAGTRIHDWAFGLKTKSSVASGTVDVGLVAADGSGYMDLANTVADDPDNFADALVTGSGGTDGTFTRKGAGATVPGNTPILVEKDCYLRVTINTEAATDLVLDIVLEYEFVGNK